MNQKQIDFMLMLDGYEMDIFSLEEVKRRTRNKLEDINELTENLVRKNILSRIERGKYCRTHFRDENVIGSALVSDGTISYWSALSKYGLTEQFPNSVFIQTTKKKRDKTIFGVYYKFIKIAPSKRSGITQEGYGNHSYRITNLEKTIADCFDLPRYSGGYAELIRAFYLARLDNENLITACKAIHNIATTKRMGYLAELLKKSELQDFIQFAKEQVNERYDLFDPTCIEVGKFISAWKLRQNINDDEIRDIIESPY